MLHPHHRSGDGAIRIQHHVTMRALMMNTHKKYPMIARPLAICQICLFRPLACEPTSQIRLVYRPLACCEVRLPRSPPLACEPTSQIRHVLCPLACCQIRQPMILKMLSHMDARNYRNCGLFHTNRATVARNYRNCGLVHTNATVTLDACRIPANCIMAKLVIIQHTSYSPS